MKGFITQCFTFSTIVVIHEVFTVGVSTPTTFTGSRSRIHVCNAFTSDLNNIFFRLNACPNSWFGLEHQPPITTR